MRLRTGAMVAGLLLSAVTTFAQTIRRDFDRTADFGRFKTYAWVRGTSLDDELNHRRIVHAIDGQLQAKGMRLADANSKPDVLVAYHAALGSDKQIIGQGFRFGPGASARVESILIGTLAVDIIDANTRAIVWRGIASKDLDTGATPEKREKNINKAVEKLFKQYPPAH